MPEQAVNRALLAHLAEQSVAGLDIRGLALALTIPGATASLCRGSLQSGDTITIETEMYGASLTKQLIGALVAMACEEGTLTYESRTGEFVADLPAWMADIRTRHLLHHTSGIPDLATNSDPWPADNAALLDALRATTLTAEPAGTRHAYNNAGYILLAEVLARAYGRPIGGLAEERLFAPLGMRHSRLGGPVRRLPGYTDPPGTVGDGGWWTTIEDLHTWLVALNERRVPFDVRRIESAGQLDDGTSVPYGWGLGLREVAGHRAIIHGGGWDGWVSMARRLPDLGIVVAVMTQCNDDQAVIELAKQIENSLLSLLDA